MIEIQRRYRLTRSLPLSFSNKLARLIWSIVWILLFRPTPRAFHVWRCFLLRIFGAQLEEGVHPYPSARIWAPWNLIMKENSCIGEYVDCYCVDKIIIGKNSTISQYSFLCTASHDYTRIDKQLVTAPVIIEDEVWVFSDVFIGPGVTIEEGSVVLARSSVYRDVQPWKVYAGNPAHFVKNREINQ